MFFTASAGYIRGLPSNILTNEQKFIQTSAVYIQYLSKTSNGRISPTQIFITQKSLRKAPESRLAKRTSYIFFKKKLLNFYKSKKSNIFAVRKIKRTYKI
jgi:catabolite regulation protein CreA